MADEKKPAKQKAKKEKEGSAPRGEVDAVKAFIVVMLVLDVALGVFILITAGKLSDVDRLGLARAKAMAPKMTTTALQIQEYLKLIGDSGETTLLTSPERFFGNIYQSVGIDPKQVAVGPQKDSVNRRDKYTEYSWDLEVSDITRKQAALFAHGVETSSPKARIIEMTLRRSKKKDAPEDTWDARFKIGYRAAGTTKDRP